MRLTAFFLMLFPLLLQAQITIPGYEPPKQRIERAHLEKSGIYVDARDNQRYEWRGMADMQVWMTENLNYRPQEGKSWCYDDEASNCRTYGRLYDWETSQKVCPSGWHLPSDREWQRLVDALGGDDVAGGKMKSTRLWESPNAGATNSSGFSGLPGGNRYDAFGDYDGLGKIGYWWSATESSSSNAWRWRLVRDYGSVLRYDIVKENGYSVRCVRDE
jgi:uncharacterized protein (TIGR02145 family)